MKYKTLTARELADQLRQYGGAKVYVEGWLEQDNWELRLKVMPESFDGEAGVILYAHYVRPEISRALLLLEGLRNTFERDDIDRWRELREIIEKL